MEKTIKYSNFNFSDNYWKSTSFLYNKNIVKMVVIVLCFSLALISSGQNYSFFGKLDKPSPIYKPGEKMVFTITLFNENKPVSGKKLKWTRTGDDSITANGEGISSAEGFKIITSTDKPGFVRVYVTAYDNEGKQLTGQVKEWGIPKEKNFFFDGGACVAPDTLAGVAEPADFDAYWQKQKELLASVPLKVLEMKKVESNNKVNVFDVKLTCAGKMPVSGYLIMPKNSKPKSLEAEVCFLGYGVRSAAKNLSAGEKKIYFNINAHGIENGRPREYYNNLKKNSLKNYAFDKKENSNPDTCYFRDMFLRAMRALEFVKSLPEWNGKDLKVNGGSQGGMQSLAAAGLDRDVTYCYAWAPWCCDMGGKYALKRLVGEWYIEYTPALNYFDPINFAKRANPECKLHIIANLGDYICPPSGVWIAYNNFPGPKTIVVRQGCEHSFIMENHSEFLFHDNQ